MLLRDPLFAWRDYNTGNCLTALYHRIQSESYVFTEPRNWSLLFSTVAIFQVFLTRTCICVILKYFIVHETNGGMMFRRFGQSILMLHKTAMFVVSCFPITHQIRRVPDVQTAIFRMADVSVMHIVSTSNRIRRSERVASRLTR